MHVLIKYKKNSAKEILEYARTIVQLCVDSMITNSCELAFDVSSVNSSELVFSIYIPRP